MNDNRPTVSIGLPVFNGENYLEEAVDSILDQSFVDFELVISDNASTDRTPEICKGFAAHDRRVTYVRQPSNLGASANYTAVFAASTGRYFKWSAHDDVCEPDFLASCVDVLEAEPQVVLCHTKTVITHPDGVPIKEWGFGDRFLLDRPHERFRQALGLGKMCLIWGVMRREALQRTALLGNFTSHDRPLISGLSLLGRFVEVPAVLFRLREHPARSIRAFNWRRPQEAISWYDPRKGGKITFPTWRLLREHLMAIWRAQLPPGEAALCLRELAKWASGKRSSFGRDLRIAREWLAHGPPNEQRSTEGAGSS